jgi:hypothetical protein
MGELLINKTNLADLKRQKTILEANLVVQKRISFSYKA